MKTRTKVVIINGAPMSGKDTFANLAQSYCNNDESANVLNLSSVEQIKEALERFGWDGNKTENIRDIIAGIKKIWVDAQNGPTTYMINSILEWHKSHIGEDNIVFCHIREPEEIDKLVNALSGMDVIGIYVTTLLIVRDIEQVDTEYSRDSDNPDIITNYHYEHIINNYYDLAKYDEIVCNFVDMLLEEED